MLRATFSSKLYFLDHFVPELWPGTAQTEAQRATQTHIQDKFHYSDTTRLVSDTMNNLDIMTCQMVQML